MFGDAGYLTTHLIIIVPDVLALTPEGYVPDLVVSVDEEPEGEEDHQCDPQPSLPWLTHVCQLLEVGVAAETVHEEDILPAAEIVNDIIKRLSELSLQMLLRGAGEEAEVPC